MPWPSWAKINEKGLAQYALPEVANRLRLDVNRDDALARPNGHREVAASIYRALCGCKVRYSAPLYNPDLAQQDIRDPNTILDGAGLGTCLDLALLYAGAAHGNDLLALLVLLKGHALVAVATGRGRRDAGKSIRKTEEGTWVTDGVLRDADLLRQLVDDEHYVLVEATGFSASYLLPATVPEGVARVNGLLDFDRATKAGREQLDHADRPFLFAVDVAVLQDVGRLVPHEPPGRSLDAVPDLRRRLSGVMESHRIFGGRQDDLDTLDAFVAGPSGYALVTGPSGCGKSALLANWIRQRTERGNPVAYHFVNRHHQLARHDDTLRTLVQQLRYWRGQPGLAGGMGAELEATFLKLVEETPAPLTIVIDGLDEADGWEPGPQLFPHPLPTNLHVIVSAREIADGDWGKKLQLPLSHVVPVGPLSAAGIPEVLQSAHAPEWVTTPEAVAALAEKSGGDAFFLRQLIADLSPELAGKPPRIRRLADLANQPSGLDEYLGSWWDEIEKAVKADKSVKQFLGYLLVARGPLSRNDLLGLGPDDILDWSTVDSAVELIQRFVLGDADDGYRLSHWRFQDYLSRKKIPPSSQAPYRERLMAWCAAWQDNKYALRHGLDHFLDDSLRGPGGGARAAVEFCLHHDGAFLPEAIKTAGLGWVEDQVGRVLAAAFGRREWDNTAAALLVLRHLHRLGRPVVRAMALLFGSDPGAIPDGLVDLGRVANQSTRLAMAVLAAARWHDAEQPAGVGILLSWIGQQSEVAQTATSSPAVEALNAVLDIAPAELVERLLDLPLFTAARQRWMVLIALWVRSRREHHRSAVLLALKSDPESATPEASSAVEWLVREATQARDGEMLLAACRWLGRCPQPLQVERLALGKIVEKLPAEAIQAVELLGVNKRMSNYKSLRAKVCALMLADAPLTESEFGRLAAELAAGAGVTICDVSRSLAEYAGRWGDTWAMTPVRFREWLSVRLAFLLQVFTNPDDDEQALLRLLTVNLCTVLRWVATQEPPEAGNQAVIGECLCDISALAWRRPAPCSAGFIEAANRVSPLTGQIDPLRAAACLRTATWLAGQGRLPFVQRFLADDVDRAARREILRLVFSPGRESELDRLDGAFTAAWGRPAPGWGDNVSHSPWLTAYRALADAAGVSWQQSWEPDLGNKYHPLPERFSSFLMRGRERVVKVYRKHGWHPALVDLEVNLIRLLSDEETGSETAELVLGALAEMDPEVMARCPNDMVDIPSFFPVVFARRLPRPLAPAMAELELNNDGVLKRLAEDLCRPSADAGWWESVRQFRDELRRLVLPKPQRIVWYMRTEPAAKLLEPPLAPLNLLLDDQPKPEDLEETAAGHWLMRRCLAANPQPEVLAWAVEKFRGYGNEYRLWLLKPLLRSHRWDLLPRVLEGPSGDHSDDADLLRGFNLPDPDIKQSTSRPWSDVLAQALGMGPVEGIIYRVPALAKQIIAGTPFDDPYILQHCEATRLNPDWRETVRSALQLKDARTHEVVLTLLVVTLFTGSAEPAMLAAEINSERDSSEQQDLGPQFLWVGKAAAPALLTRERIEAVARTGNGLDVLVALGDWSAVRLHLRARAAKTPDWNDPLLEWYRATAEFGPDEQLACLEIYLELAPALLVQRGSALQPLDDLAPVREVSRTLKFAGHTLPEPVAVAARGARAALAQAWFRAVLFEAANGPDRRADVKALETVCGCAGAWLTVEHELGRRSAWLEFIARVDDELGTRELWRALFRGAALVRQEGVLDEVLGWPVPDQIKARLAIGEVFTQHGQLPAVKAFWDELIRGSPWPWLISLRACDAVQSRREIPEYASLAREFIAQAWQSAQAAGELPKEFLAALVERAVQSRAELVLQSVEEAIRHDRPRLAVLGRIALDAFLEEVQTESQRGAVWRLIDLKGRALEWAVTALVEESVEEAEPSDLAEYNHAWSESNRCIGSGLGWLAALLQTLLDATAVPELLAWLGTWITRIDAFQDKDGAVGVIVAKWAAEAEVVPAACGPLLDFAMDSILGRQMKLSVQLELVRGLLKAGHRTDDCLRMLDENLSAAENYRHWGVTEAAVICGETLPNPRVAERYLGQLASGDRTLAEDRIGEKRGEGTATRLKRLLSVPQTTEVVNRLLSVIYDALNQLKTETDENLQAISTVAARLLADSPRLNDHLASELGQLLSPNAVTQLRSSATLLNRNSY